MALVLDAPVREAPAPEVGASVPWEHTLVGLPPALADLPRVSLTPVAADGGPQERSLGFEMLILVVLLLGAVLVGAAAAAAGIALTV